MAKLPWFRLYTEWAYDPKIQSMNETLQRRYIMLLCVTCNGEIKKLSESELAFALRITAEDLKNTKKVFIEKNFIDDEWNVRAWNDRQFQSDRSNERVKRYREKRKRYSNGDVTAQDTDTDTDIKETIIKKKSEDKKAKRLTAEKNFRAEVFSYSDMYEAEMLEAFFSYWSEPNKSGTQMKQQMQKTWDIERRLGTWARNNFSNNGDGAAVVKMTEDQKHEQVKENFINHFYKHHNIKSTFEAFANSPYRKQIYKDMKKCGLTKEMMVGKGPGIDSVVTKYENLVAKLRGNG
jgi:hypothetical protein